MRVDLEARRRNLEERFFREREEQILDAFRKKHGDELAEDALARSSGIRDMALVDTLFGLGVRATTVPALVLAPLVAVAWADGEVQYEEREEILAEAEKLGIRSDVPAAELLAGWLEEPPGPELLECWVAYAAEIARNLDAAGHAQWQHEVCGASERVARASRSGKLGLSRKISRQERTVLAAIRAVFADQAPRADQDAEA